MTFQVNINPNESIIKKLMRKIETPGSVEDRKTSDPPRSGRHTDNIATVAHSVAEETSMSRLSLT